MKTNNVRQVDFPNLRWIWTISLFLSMFLLLTSALPMDYVVTNIVQPELHLINTYEAVPLPPIQQSRLPGTDVYVTPWWLFLENGKDLFVQTEVANKDFEFWYAGMVCMSLSLDCRFTTPQGQTGDEYDSLRIFVPTRNADRFLVAWKPIDALRLGK